jgi:hypothetical protein
MPTFDTPEPISVAIDVSVGHVHLVATDRNTTVVEVRPHNGAKRGDTSAAEQTRVEYSDGHLSIAAPKGWRHLTPLGGRESIDVEIALPAGSQLRGAAAVADLRATGRLGDCRFKISAGSIKLAESGSAQLKTSVGDIIVERVAGDADITTSSGALRVGAIDGAAVVKNSNGETWIGAVGGDLRVNSANGRIVVERAQSAVVAKTANGDIRLGEVGRGIIRAETNRGRVDIGVVEGVAAFLDLKTQFGNVRSGLDASPEPQAGEDSVEVRARTSLGDITISRARVADAGRKK